MSECLLLGLAGSVCAGRQKPGAEILITLIESDVAVPESLVQGGQGKHSKGLIPFGLFYKSLSKTHPVAFGRLSVVVRNLSK